MGRPGNSGYGCALFRREDNGMKYQAFHELYGRFLDTSGIADKMLDVAYGPYPRNRLDIYYPDDRPGPWPVVVFFHGGAFFKGDKGRYQLRPALFGLERGYAVVSVNYRLAPADYVPAAFLDARMALQYLKANAQALKLDPGRMAVWGESAGASLACYVGLVKEPELSEDPLAPYPGQSCEVGAVIDWYAPVDMASLELEHRTTDALRIEGKTLHEFACGCGGDALLELLRKVDPSNYLHPGIPPVLIQHGTADTVVPVGSSLRFREKLLAYLPEDMVPLDLVEGAEHGVAAFENKENLERIFDFLDRCLN